MDFSKRKPFLERLFFMGLTENCVFFFNFFFSIFFNLSAVSPMTLSRAPRFTPLFSHNIPKQSFLPNSRPSKSTQNRCWCPSLDNLYRLSYIMASLKGHPKRKSYTTNLSHINKKDVYSKKPNGNKKRIYAYNLLSHELVVLN